jgi:hypothetical protein
MGAIVAHFDALAALYGRVFATSCRRDADTKRVFENGGMPSDWSEEIKEYLRTPRFPKESLIGNEFVLTPPTLTEELEFRKWRGGSLVSKLELEFQRREKENGTQNSRVTFIRRSGELVFYRSNDGTIFARRLPRDAR